MAATDSQTFSTGPTQGPSMADGCGSTTFPQFSSLPPEMQLNVVEIMPTLLIDPSGRLTVNKDRQRLVGAMSKSVAHEFPRELLVTDLLTLSHYVHNLVEHGNPSESFSDMNATCKEFEGYCAANGAPTLGSNGKQASRVHVALPTADLQRVLKTDQSGVEEIVKRLAKYPDTMRATTEGLTCYISQGGDTPTHSVKYRPNGFDIEPPILQDRMLNLQRIASAAGLPLASYVDEQQVWQEWVASQASPRLIGQNTMYSSHPNRLVPFLANPTEADIPDIDTIGSNDTQASHETRSALLSRTGELLDKKWSLKVKIDPSSGPRRILLPFQRDPEFNAGFTPRPFVPSVPTNSETAPFRDSDGNPCWSDPSSVDIVDEAEPFVRSPSASGTSTSDPKPPNASPAVDKEVPMSSCMKANPWSHKDYDKLLSCLVAQRRLAHTCTEIYRQHSNDPTETPTLEPTVIELPAGSDVLKAEIEAGLQTIIDESKGLKGGQYVSQADFEVTMQNEGSGSR